MTTLDARPWQDRSLPVADRVALLLAAMTLEEKAAQLVGLWPGQSTAPDEFAPGQNEHTGREPVWAELVGTGLGQLTRIFGTAPLEPAAAARELAGRQRELVDGGRLGIPAIAHEECLTGFTAWRATVFPTPLAWGATFDPESVGRMAAAVGAGMRDVGIQQALSPVLDVTRDPRWGRTEETLGEDPYLVSVLGAAYVRGLESAGLVATLKHFAGYSASAGGRNHAPVPIGPRELADVVLPPFEAALRIGGARAVMPSYAEVDGMPPHADRRLLTDLLRGEWGFDGVVVSDYFGVSFLESAHGVAGSPAGSAARALAAGVDVELPAVRCFGRPLLDAVRAGDVPEALVDRAVTRVLRQKCELGLLEPDWDPQPPALRSGGPVELDTAELRGLAATVAERSVVLLDDPAGTLPLRPVDRVAVVGPVAAEVRALMGCYAFPNHVGDKYPDVPLGIAVPTLLDAVRAEFPAAAVAFAEGCPVQEPDTAGIAAAASLAAEAGLCVLAVGDRAGIFGRGTSGEGCDAEDLALPGSQAELVEAVLATGVPTVLVVLSGRPYALGPVAGRAAVVQAFFPGQEGAAAVAGVLSGRINPSGRLPVQVPARPGGQPAGYLHPPLGGPNPATSVDPGPLFPFGHGLSYTTFGYADLAVSAAELPTDGSVEVSCLVRNTGDRDGAEVVQLYLHQPVAPVTRPVRQLLGFARVELAAGQARRVTFRVHADRTAYTGVDLTRAVEPGPVELLIGPSSADLPLRATIGLVGPRRPVGHDRVLVTPVRTD